MIKLNFKNVSFFKILLICIFIINNSAFIYANDNDETYDQYHTFDYHSREIRFPINENFYFDAGERIDTDLYAYINNEGFTMIPLRQVCSLYDIYWDETDMSVTVTSTRPFKFTANKKEVVFGNGNTYKIKGRSEIKSINGNDVFYIPIRIFGELVGPSVSWDKDTSSAILNKVRENPF